jgi:3-oxoacyl-(acyl-carrier-protein) synthase
MTPEQGAARMTTVEAQVQGYYGRSDLLQRIDPSASFLATPEAMRAAVEQAGLQRSSRSISPRCKATSITLHTNGRKS